ncbi:MAG: hypothetical protein MHMPM18_001988 [Marteilia pararefringens]
MVMRMKRQEKLLFEAIEKTDADSASLQIKDVATKRQWTVTSNRHIASGGFGRLYDIKCESMPDSNCIVKIEPNTNGPLFCEINFFQRCPTQKNREKFLKEKKLKLLGIPLQYANGISAIGDYKFRYLIMQKFKLTLFDIMNNNLTSKILNDYPKFDKMFNSLGHLITIILSYITTRVRLTEVNPIYLIPAALSLASKINEYGVISHSRLIAAFGDIVNKSYSYMLKTPINSKKFTLDSLMELEFLLIDVLDCSLIIFLPYRDLKLIVRDPQIGSYLEETSWCVINDSLYTDVSLLYSPFEIALGCLLVSASNTSEDLKQWFTEINVNFYAIFRVIQYLTKYFHLMSLYDEEDLKDCINLIEQSFLT